MNDQDRMLQLLMWLEDVGSVSVNRFLHVCSQKLGDAHWDDYRPDLRRHFLLWGEDLMNHWEYPSTCKYHTFDHCLRVATRALEFWGQDIAPTASFEIAPDCCIEPLVVAALWHDAGYQPKFNDDVNVPVAIARFTSAYQDSGMYDEGLAHRVCDLIASTHSPYDQNRVFNRQDHHMTVLRDADLLEVSDEHSVAIINSLYEEFHENGKFTGDCADWLVAQTRFLTAYAPSHISNARMPLFLASSDRWRDTVDPNWRTSNGQTQG